MTGANFYHVVVCKELVLFYFYCLSYHLGNRYQLSMNNYKRQINCINPCNKHLHYILELKSLIKNIPVVEPRQKIILKADGLPHKYVTKDCGNLSFFKCHSCSRSNITFSTLAL